MKKQCSKCKRKKDTSEFYSDKRTQDGLYSACKKCHGKNKSRPMLFYIKRHPTPSNVASYMMFQILGRVRYRKCYAHVRLEFSKDELMKFLKENWSTYLKYYRRWKRENWKKGFAPSLDRIDSEKHYSIKNIQIISHSENSSKPRNRNRQTTTPPKS